MPRSGMPDASIESRPGQSCPGVAGAAGTGGAEGFNEAGAIMPRSG